MVRNYVRKTARGSFSPEILIEALESVKAGSSIRNASLKYNIPRRTLNNYWLKFRTAASSSQPVPASSVNRPPSASQPRKRRRKQSQPQSSVPQLTHFEVILPDEPPPELQFELTVPNVPVVEVLPQEPTVALVPAVEEILPDVPLLEELQSESTVPHVPQLKEILATDPLLQEQKVDSAVKYLVRKMLLEPPHASPSPGVLSIGYAKKKVFTPAQETTLAECLTKASDVCAGLTTKEVRQFAYAYAHTCSRKVPNSWTVNEMAGPDWCSTFLKANPDILIKTPQGTSVSRAKLHQDKH